MLDILSKAREASHSLLAVLGLVAGAQGVILTTLATLGVHVSALNLSQGLGIAGSAVLGLSKLIDSVNDAFRGASASTVQAAAITATAGSGPVAGAPSDAVGSLTAAA